MLLSKLSKGLWQTYRGCSVGTFAAAAGTGPLLVIEGSATKRIVVMRIILSDFHLTAAEFLQVICQKYSTAASGDAGTALVQVPDDSVFAAGTLNRITVHTTAPTAGTLVGTVGMKGIRGATATVGASQPDHVIFDFSENGAAGGIVLNGVAQGLAVRFVGAPATAVTTAAHVEWAETPTTVTS